MRPVTRKRLETSVHRILRLCLGPDADIEALAHDVFARAARQMATLRRPRPIKQMVMSATVAICKQHGRRRRCRAPERPLPAPDVLTRVNRSDRAAMILLLIETVESSYRQVVASSSAAGVAGTGSPYDRARSA